MPLPILLAHRLSRGLADDRKNGTAPWLRPDGKTQVSVLYEGNTPKSGTDLVVSTQHCEEIHQAEITEYIRKHLVPRVLGQWFHSAITFHINPTGSFSKGGPSADCGVTGRKTIVDTYGGAARQAKYWVLAWVSLAEEIAMILTFAYIAPRLASAGSIF